MRFLLPSCSMLRVRIALLLASVLLIGGSLPANPGAPSPEKIRETMRRATTFMIDKVSCNGGYVWSYLPDFSRRWGEIEARETMIWIQAPGTPGMGHLFLDAYHATADEYYYAAACQVAAALIHGQHPSGGWNYVVDFAGEDSLRHWYDTTGRNAWRLEEFQHYYGNATFDDGGTIDAAKLLLRLHLEKHDPRFLPALDQAIHFVLASQYPVGAWPQRFPLMSGFSKQGNPDYTGYLTFNDDVASANLDFLIMAFQALGDRRLLDPIARGMDAFLLAQQPPPQAGWALQYTPDLKPAGARTYEPRGLASHGTAAAILQLLKFHRLTGDPRFLARIPEALDWLDASQLPPELRVDGFTHPTFIEVGTGRPLYLHREGTNAANGRYFVNDDPHNTLDHYKSFRRLDVPGLRRSYEQAKMLPPSELAKNSPLLPDRGLLPLPRFFMLHDEPPPQPDPGDNALAPNHPLAERATHVIDTLDADGRWLTPLRMTSHPYIGDDTDTSPYRDEKPVPGISTGTYIRHMAVLIRYLTSLDKEPTPEPATP